MHCVAGIDDLHDFLGITVDQGDLAGITQGDAEDVFQIQVVHLLGRPVFRRNDHFPGFLHVSQAEFGRHGRLVHDVLGHQFHGFFIEVTGRQPVRHAGRGAVTDKRLEVVDTALLGDVRSQRFTSGAFTQYAVTAGAALEVDLLRFLEFCIGQIRRTWGANNFGRFRIYCTGGAFIGHGGLVRVFRGCLCVHYAQRRNGHGQCQRLDHQFGYSHQVLSLGFKSTPRFLLLWLMNLD